MVSPDDIEEFISDQRELPKLQAFVTTFGRLLYQEGPFDLPRYQRAYCWKANPNWRDFLADWVALALVKEQPWSKTNNFLGSIVVSRVEARAPGRIGLLDGQQRILTGCIALKALALVASGLDMQRERDVIDRLLWPPEENPTVNPSLANAFDFQHALRMTAAELEAGAQAARPDGQGLEPAVEAEPEFLASDSRDDGPEDMAPSPTALAPEDDDPVELTHRLQSALRYFYRNLSEVVAAEPDQPKAVRALMRALLAYTRIVVIKLAKGDDGLEIFNRLNSRAELLSMLDRLKIVLLEAARRAEEDPDLGLTRDQILYEQHWAPVFESPEKLELWDDPAPRFRDSPQHQDLLMRAFLSSRKGERVDSAYTLIEMRRLLNETSGGAALPREERAQLAENLIRSLSELGASYATINGTPPLDRFGPQVARIQLFSRFAAEPLLVSLHAARWEDEEAVVPILDMLESVAVRRFFNKSASVQDYEVYARLCRHVDQRSDLSGAALAGDLHRRLARIGRKHAFWTSDRSFLHDVQHRELADRKAGPTAKERKQLFKIVFALLDAQAQGRKNPTPELADPRFTVEHLYPINGHEDWPEVTKAGSPWLIRIGNLTMVDDVLNREMGDSAWPVKHGMIADRCSIHLNRALVENADWREHWTPQQIRERGLSLAKLAVARWPGPESPSWPRQNTGG